MAGGLIQAISQFMKRSDFYYDLPERLIAQMPLSDRTASRMLCLDKITGALCDRQFGDLLDLLNPGDLLVFNDTKVIPARLYGHKSTGGRVEVLIERITTATDAVAHVKASKAPKTGTLLILDGGQDCEVLGRDGDLFRLGLRGDRPWLQLLAEVGHIPLPPYIQRADDAGDLDRYQTVFARQAGAVAAPTAGLHFDDDMMQRLTRKGLTKAFVTLHVGSGTFQPVRVDDLAQHVMHKEWYSVGTEVVEAVRQTRAGNGRVVAVGTTAVRALESASASGELLAGSGDTALFITPGYRFKSVDAMLTNFHLPESTLLMLISAFAGYEPVMQAYRHAIACEYRFFSYGDAMLIA